MTIEFHCDHCGKLVRTSDEHAGKRGKCPHCHLSVYIPTPSEEIEPLRLAPIDEDAEQERRRMEQEARQLAQKLRDERDVPPETVRAPLPEPIGDVRLSSDMEHLITEYVLAMAGGKLSEAEELARDIHANKALADEFLQRLTMDELPPARLAKIPRAVMLGFIKQLRKSG